MASLAYQLEDSLSAKAAKHRNSVLGRLCAVCSVMCAIFGDTLRSLGDTGETQ